MNELDRRILPLFCLGFDGIVVPGHIRAWLQAGLSGVILFSRNLRDIEQICALTADLRAAGAQLIGVDQEGGRVVRLPPPFTIPPPAAAIGRTGDPAFAEELAYAIGTELRAAGFNWNLVPVLDVHTNPANPIIGDRAFGSDPDLVARMGLATARGYARAGLLTTAKHFPGHGDTSVDSHLALPVCHHPRARWDAIELSPFREAIRAGVPSIMLAHLACPALDAELPTSLSPAVITEMLRKQLGYDGLVVCDDLEMAAVAGRYSSGEATVRFLEAGGDLVLICRDAARQQEAVAAVRQALEIGRITEARLEPSLARVQAFRPPASASADIEPSRASIGCPSHQELLKRIQ